MQRTGSILVIDNEPTINDLIVEVLTDAGYVAYAVLDDTAALAAIARFPPALILLALRMPGISIAAFIAEIYEIGPATMPIVGMTTAPSAAMPTLIAGVSEYLAKPFEIDNLLACVTRYVQPARMPEHASTRCASCPASMA